MIGTAVTAERIHVRNPRTGRHDYVLAATTNGELRSFASSLRENQPEWSAAGLDYRIDVLRRWGRQIHADRERILAALAVDTGRVRLSLNEIDNTVARIHHWCDRAPRILENAVKAPPDDGSVEQAPIECQRQLVPYPLVGAIGPWNSPFTLALIDALPALLAGSAVIVKPSEVTPRFIEPLGNTIHAVPELGKVLRLVSGAAATGAALIELVDLVCFTGGVDTGREVAVAAATRFIPSFLELGGKDPAIVFASADLDSATNAILRAAVVNSGQVCWSVERVYVQDTVYREFLGLLMDKARRVRINYPDITAGHLGPLILEGQAAVIREQLADAGNRGARIELGGQIEQHGGGYWCRPTVVTAVDHDMKLMREETFGPIVPIMPFAKTNEAIRLANDTDFGLSASVFSGSVAEAVEVARRIDAGAVSINDAALISRVRGAEKHAFKWSGLGGSRRGPEGLLRFFRKKALLLQTGTPGDVGSIREPPPGR